MVIMRNYTICNLFRDYKNMFRKRMFKMPSFSSGPCSKPPYWKPEYYKDSEAIGRSHRSDVGLARIQDLLNRMRDILEIPSNYHIGLVAGSATGAMECLLWSLLGEKPVDVINACLFSSRWEDDIRNELRISDVRSIKSDLWELQSLERVDFKKDVVFCWTGTTAGISVNNADWISNDRTGLTICDATSAIFCSRLDWKKLDATSFSWQKGLGGESGIGTIVLSPAAIDRLERYRPDRPIPRIYRLANDGVVNFGIFEGKTTNTPSMLCVEDFHACLDYAQFCDGIGGLINKVETNYQVMKAWEESQNVFKFCVQDESVRARNVLCFDIKESAYMVMSDAKKWDFIRQIAARLENDRIGCDIIGHIATTPHIRIWCGPTVLTENLIRLSKALSKIGSELM